MNKTQSRTENKNTEQDREHKHTAGQRTQTHSRTENKNTQQDREHRAGQRTQRHSRTENTDQDREQTHRAGQRTKQRRWRYSRPTLIPSHKSAPTGFEKGLLLGQELVSMETGRDRVQKLWS